MPDGAETYTSKWFKYTDIDEDQTILTITGSYSHEFTDSRDKSKKNQIVITFKEHEKHLGLNLTNYTICRDVYGSTRSEDWHGKRIVLMEHETPMGPGVLVMKRATEKANMRPERKLTEEQAAPPPARHRPPRATQPVTQEEIDADDEIPF